MVTWGSWPWAASLGFHFAAAEVEQGRSQRAEGWERWCQQHQGASERTWARAWPPTASQGRFAPSPAQLPRQWAEGGAQAALALLEPQPWCPGAFEAPAEPQRWLGPSPADLGFTKASPHPTTSTRTSRESFGNTLNCEHPMSLKRRDVWFSLLEERSVLGTKLPSLPLVCTSSVSPAKAVDNFSSTAKSHWSSLLLLL